MDRSVWRTRRPIKNLSPPKGRAPAVSRSGLVHWPALKAWSEEEDEVHSPANLVGRLGLRRSFASRLGSDALEQMFDRGLKDCMGKSISAVMLLALTLACTAAGAQEAAQQVPPPAHAADPAARVCLHPK